MSWLIDALREPAAAVVQLAVSGLALALAARIRGKQRQNVERLDELERAVPVDKPSGS